MTTVARSSNRGSKPGERRGGRTKGTPNKTTAAFKEAIVAVYADLQSERADLGEHGHFLEWAKATPTEFYKLASKLLPLQVNADVQADVTTTVIERRIVRPSN